MFMLRLDSSLTALAALLMASRSSGVAGAFAAGCSGAAGVPTPVEVSRKGASHTIPLHPRTMLKPAGDQRAIPLQTITIRRHASALHDWSASRKRAPRA